MANFRRDGAKERAWRERLRRYVESGLSVRAFCRRESLTEASFYAWRRTLAERDAAATAAGSRTKQPAFLPILVQGGERRMPAGLLPSATITLELAGGRALHLPETIAAERLADLMAALEARGVR